MSRANPGLATVRSADIISKWILHFCFGQCWAGIALCGRAKQTLIRLGDGSFENVRPRAHTTTVLTIFSFEARIIFVAPNICAPRLTLPCK